MPPTGAANAKGFFYGFKALESRPGRTLLPFVIIRAHEH
jgi:hypothetical protein